MQQPPLDDTTATKRQRLASKAIEGELPSAEAGDPSFEDTSAAGALVLDVAGSVLETAVEEVAAVARLRGLPWSHSAGEVCEFLGTIGLKVQPEAVTMLHNAAGEAFITLERQDQMAEVLKANRQQIGKRYVECFESSAAERQQVCERNRATMREDAGYRGVLRLRGLPFSCTVDEILEFFARPAALQADNVHLMRRADGRPSGDAYAVFDTEEAAVACLAFDKQKLGPRWVDLFQSSKVRARLFARRRVISPPLLLSTRPGALGDEE